MELDRNLNAICEQYDDIINEWEDIEYLMFFFVRNLCYKRADAIRDDCSKEDKRKNRLLLGHIRRHSDWDTFWNAICAEFECPYETDAIEDMKYLYKLICSYIDYNQDLLRAWNVTYIARAFKEYINTHCVSWEMFSYLLYQFTVFYPFGSDIRELSAEYTVYLQFMEKHRDVIKQYLDAVDAHYQFLEDNSLTPCPSNKGHKFEFKSSLTIDEYDETRYNASIEKKNINEDAFQRKINHCEYVKLTPCLKRGYIESFVYTEDADGLWDYLKSFGFDGVEYKD
jgi:hypothetical protein